MPQAWYYAKNGERLAPLSPAEPPEDLREALQRLAAARGALACEEKAFADYCQQLAAFASDYRLHLGDACEELDRLSAQLEALLAQRLSQRRAKRRTIPRRTPAARPAASAVTALALSLRDLYRIAARRFHPDLACDSADREWRAAMMRRVNAALAQGDSATLQTLLDQSAATHPIPSSWLAAIEFEIAQTLARIADVNATREQMEASDVGQLHAQATAEGQAPIAFLRRLAAAARAEILEKRALLAELTSPEASP